jgi:hypothetical protein
MNQIFRQQGGRRKTRRKKRKRKGGRSDLCKLYNNTHFPKRYAAHRDFNISRSGDGGGPPPKEDVEMLKKLRPVSGRLEAAKKAKGQDEKTAKKAATEKAHAQMRRMRAKIFSGDAMGTNYVKVTGPKDKYPEYKRKEDKKRADKYCEENYLGDGTPITSEPSNLVGPRRRRANTCTPIGCRFEEEKQELDPTSSSVPRAAENFQDLARERGHVPWDASNPGVIYEGGGRRKTRRKKRRKKKRKTKKRRKRKKRKTKKRYRNQRGCKR